MKRLLPLFALLLLPMFAQAQLLEKITVKDGSDIQFIKVPDIQWVDAAGDYAWNLWRPYKCCTRRGQWFLGDIDWVAFP